MDLWLLAFQAAGVAFVITRSSLFSPLRSHGPEGWRSFIGCQLCVGVWAGIGMTAAQAFLGGSHPRGAGALAGWALAAVGTGALAGIIALGFAVVIDFADSLGAAATKLSLGARVPGLPPPRLSFPDEQPTDPAPRKDE